MLKSDPHLPKKCFFFASVKFFASSYSLKVLLLLEIFKFLSSLFGYVGKLPDKKAEVNLKTYDLSWFNISRSKGDHTMKFSQLME